MAFLKASGEKLAAALNESRTALAEVQAKGEMYDRVRTKADQLERDHNALTQQNLLQALTIKARGALLSPPHRLRHRLLTTGWQNVSADKEETSRQLQDLQQTLDLLRMDKVRNAVRPPLSASSVPWGQAYLTKEVDSLAQRTPSAPALFSP